MLLRNQPGGLVPLGTFTTQPSVEMFIQLLDKGNLKC
tara:strand:+ start:930 stop:1040 length:111 start_codon:yes stop_codon:yes gene_type:complete